MENNDYQSIFLNNPPLEDLLSHPKWNEWINSEIFVFELINKTTFNNFESLSADILKKPAIVLSALEKFYLDDKQIPEALANDKSFFMYCCKLDIKYAQLFVPLLNSSEDLAWWYVNEFKPVSISQYLPQKYCEGIAFANEMIANNIHNYEHLGTNVRNDLSIYESLTEEERIIAYPFSGPQITSHWKLSLEMVAREPSNYKFVDSTLQKNPDFYLEILDLTLGSVTKNLLKYAPTTIQNNEKCVWKSVLKNSISIQFASSRLLNSTSFANQVLASLRDEQLQATMDYWTLHVKNSKDVFENILPKIIKGEALSLVGPELKENEEFMLKCLFLDSKQTLDCCAPVLLNNSQFIIKAYHLIDEKNLHKDRYDEDSEQSQIFDHITEKATEDKHFILSLYKEFKDIFISIVYPKIKSHPNTMVQQLNVYSKKENGLSDFLDKMLLKEELDLELNADENQPNKKKPKI